MKSSRPALIFSIAIVIASIFLADAYVERARAEGDIAVTGLGKADFSSDLVVWEARFQAENADLKAAYAELEKSRSFIRAYLMEEGLTAEAIVYWGSSVIQ